MQKHIDLKQYINCDVTCSSVDWQSASNHTCPLFLGLHMEMNEKRKNAGLRKFGASVRRFRRMQKLTQEEFAEKCEMQRSYISQIERGERNISLSTVIKISDFLKVNISEMLADLDKWPKQKGL